MKTIPLTQGKVALVDDEDFERVNQFKWHAHYNGLHWYATRHENRPSRKKITMHRFIMNAQPDQIIDHINHDGLDNRRSTNLRFCNHSQNSGNQRISRNNTSGYKGVTWNAHRRKWEARISYHIGTFDNPEDAARAYDKFAKEHFGKFAFLNFPE